MKVRKITLICMIFLIILSLGVVSADDNVTADVSQNALDDGIIAGGNHSNELIEIEDCRIHVPEKYSDATYWGEDIVDVEDMPDDANGNISISVDEIERYNRKVIMGPNAISLYDLNLDYGSHNIIIKYDGDGKYAGFIKNFTSERIYLDVSCPDEFLISGGDNMLDVTLSKGITGNIKILIDNSSVYNKIYDAKNPPHISLSKYVGVHTYEVRYFNGNQKNLVKKGSFLGSIFNEPYISDEKIDYGEAAVFELELPEGSYGVARVKNKTYSFKSDADEWYTYVRISDLDVGENIVEFTVHHNKKTQTRNCSVFVSPKIILPTAMLANESYSLVFDASKECSGNLILSGMVNGTFKVDKGKATVPISIQNPGNYTLNVNYEGFSWDYNISVLGQSPSVFIGFTYSDEIYPWNEYYDCDPDHEDFLYYISVFADPYGLTGNTEVYLDGKLVTTLSGPCYQYHLWPDYHDFGNHTIMVSYLGDNTFKAFNRTYTYSVLPGSCGISDLGEVGVVIPEDVSGDLTVKANGKTYTKKVTKDYAQQYFNFQLENLKKDVNYTVDVSFKAKQAGYSFSKSLNFRLSCPIGGVVDEIIYGWEDSLYFSMPKDIKNKATVTIDGKEYAYTKVAADSDDDYWFDEETEKIAFKVNIADLKPGEHEVVISYPGDSKYPSNSTKNTVSINVNSEFDFEPDEMIWLNLPEDAKGNMIIETKANEQSDYVLLKNISLKEGKASFKLPVGRYYFRAYYSGDDYQVKELEYYEVIYPDFGWGYKKMNYGQKMELANGKLNASLVLCMGDNDYARLPVAWLDMTQNKPVSIDKKLIDEVLTHSMAKCILNQNYYNDGYYTLDLSIIAKTEVGTFELGSIRVNFAHKITGAKDISMLYTASKTISLNVYGLYGKPVGINQAVKIKIGKNTFTAKTNKYGVAKFKIPKTITPGKYKITVTYKTAKVSKKLTVKQILSIKTVKVKKSAKKLVLTATLKKVNGKYIRGKWIKFKFKGKTYKAKTSKKGVAKYTIKKSVLKKLKVGKKVTYQATYLKTTVKKTAKVKR